MNFSQLNEQQLHVAQSVHGAMLCVAGPGTGKTEMIAARVASILLETDANASNILCLTFTDAGAYTMRKRIAKYIGDKDASKVSIHTFHGFCSMVIAANPEFIGFPDYELATEIEESEITRALIDSLEPDSHIRKLKGMVYYYEPHLKELFSRMKREALKPSEMRNELLQYRMSLTADPDFLYKVNNSKSGAIKGEPNMNKIKDEYERIDKLIEAISLYDKYNTALRKRELYDFADMINFVNKSWNRYDFILKRYQEQYQYVLVDEFQDTNGSQFLLLKQLLDYWDNPNVLVVGDADQGIYGFQGARMENLAEFLDTFENVETIKLTQNYRSPQTVLDQSWALVGNNSMRLAKGDGLQSNTPHNTPIQAYILPTKELEAAYIAERIAALIQQGIKPSDIAIIYSKHKQSDGVLAALKALGIPYNTKRPQNALHAPLFNQLETILSFIAAERKKPLSGDGYMSDIIHYQCLGIGYTDIAQVFRLRRKRIAEELAKGEEHEYVKYTLLMAAKEYGGGQALQDFVGLFDEILSSLDTTTLEIINKIFHTLYLTRTLKQEDKRITLEVMRSIFNSARDLMRKNPHLSIEDLLNKWSAMKDNYMAININAIYGTPEGVNLLSSHASKGLEFEHVFMIDCSEVWQPTKTSKSFYIPYCLSRSTDDELETSRRAFYVSMTRAKHTLTLTVAENTADGKVIKPSIFLSEALLEPVHTMPREETVLQIETNSYSTTGQSAYGVYLSDSEIDEILQSFSLSASALNTYLECPLKFYYEYILDVPRIESDFLLFGNAVHAALHFLFREKRKAKKLPPTGRLIEYYEQYMSRKRADFAAKDWQRYVELGKQILPPYYAIKRNEWEEQDAMTEYHISGNYYGVPVKGSIDKLCLTEGMRVQIEDYKTGRYALEKVCSPDENNPIGSIYWRQGMFYKILVGLDIRLLGRTVDTCTISFVEPLDNDKYKDVELDLSAYDSFKKIILDTYGKIISKSFPKCENTECKYCG